MPLTRRQILRRRRVTVFGGLAIVLATGFYLPFTLLAPLHAEDAQVLAWEAPVTAAPELAFPGYGATAIGAVGWPGTLAVSGSTEALPIASLSKVITALVVLDAHPLAVGEEGPTLTTTSADVGLYRSYLARNGKVEPVRAGIVLSQHQLLQLTLVASANNYAATLVNWAFGSEDAYVAAARTWLDKHGLSSTSMSDATGMSPDNRATASDLIELAKLALADPLVSQIVSTTHISIGGVGEIDNTNELLGIGGVRGIKTGTLDEAGACLLFAADYTVGAETVTVVGVMLGGKDHPSLDADIQSLLATAQTGFHEVQLSTLGDEVASYQSDWGDGSTAVATADARVIVWSDTPITRFIDVEPVTLATAGTPVGKLSFVVGDRTIEVPIELTTTIDDPGAWWRLTHPDELF
jgi:serine-type D-Ala-D-Ala carboxypeptidase (penicillin-binding protein 5/6)